MRSTWFLRAAAIICLVEALAHTALFVTYSPSHGPDEVVVVETMKAHAFKFGATPHSYWEMYFAYGLFATVSVLLEAGVLWQLAGIAARETRSVTLLATLFLLGEAAYGYLIWRYFAFPIPLVTHGMVATCLLMALVFAKSPAEP